MAAMTSRKALNLVLALGNFVSLEGWVSALPKVDFATQSMRRHRVARLSAELSDSDAAQLIGKLGLAVTSPPVVAAADANVKAESIAGFPDLSQVLPLGAVPLLEFERNGHIVTRELFSTAEMEEFDGPVIVQFHVFV